VLARTPVIVLPAISPATHVPHTLHGGDRDWPETNCYVDLWIEILNALNENPAAALGFTVAQDFEGDHFTFSKFPLDDLYAQFGLEVQELSLYDTLEAHVLEQTGRGRMVVLEVDGFSLPDTRGVSYGLEHTKTTIAINRIDPARREIDYFHGPGFFSLCGDDYDSVMRTGPGRDAVLFPYAEFIKFERRKRLDAATSLLILRRHLERRPTENPVLAFRDRVADQVAMAAERPNGFLHRYAFNTARQLGMNFELLGTHLAWLDAKGAGWARLQLSMEACKALSSGAKVFQFQLARAVARRKFDGVEKSLDALAGHYTRVFDGLAGV
jgi:hypothetical protein